MPCNNTPTRRQLRTSTNNKTRKSLRLAITPRRNLTPKPIQHNLQYSTNCNLLHVNDKENQSPSSNPKNNQVTSLPKSSSLCSNDGSSCDDNNRDIVTAEISTQVDAADEATSLQGQEDAAKYEGGEDVGLGDSSGTFEGYQDEVETTEVSIQCDGNYFVLVEVKKEEYKGDDTATNNIHQEPASSSDSGGGDVSSTDASFDVTDKSTVSDCGELICADAGSSTDGSFDTSSPPITSSPSVQGEADDDNNLAMTLFTNEDVKVVDDDNPSYLLTGATITADRVIDLEHQISSQQEIIVLLQEELSEANLL